MANHQQSTPGGDYRNRWSDKDAVTDSVRERLVSPTTLRPNRKPSAIIANIRSRVSVVFARTAVSACVAVRKTIIIGAFAVALLIGLVMTLRIGSSKGLELFNAAGEGDLIAVQSLVKEGAPINQQFHKMFGWTPLIFAIFHNQTNVIKYLVDSGADVNLADGGGVTPLMWLTSEGDDAVPMAKYLIAHGARLTAKDKSGATALDYAKSMF